MVFYNYPEHICLKTFRIPVVFYGIPPESLVTCHGLSAGDMTLHNLSMRPSDLDAKLIAGIVFPRQDIHNKMYFYKISYNLSFKWQQKMLLGYDSLIIIVVMNLGEMILYVTLHILQKIRVSEILLKLYCVTKLKQQASLASCFFCVTNTKYCTAYINHD